MWWLAAMAAIQAYQSISSGFQQGAAQQAAVDERLRREKAAHAQTVGEAGATEGATGLEIGASSLSQHIANMTAEFRRQEDWSRRYGSAMAASTVQAGLSGGATDIAGGIFKTGQAANWWGATQPSGGQQ